MEKYGLDDLDVVEAAIVGFLREAWERAPYLDTKKFLQGSLTFVQAQLGGFYLFIKFLTCLTCFPDLSNLLVVTCFCRDGEEEFE